MPICRTYRVNLPSGVVCVQLNNSRRQTLQEPFYAPKES